MVLLTASASIHKRSCGSQGKIKWETARSKVCRLSARESKIVSARRGLGKSMVLSPHGHTTAAHFSPCISSVGGEDTSCTHQTWSLRNTAPAASMHNLPSLLVSPLLTGLVLRYAIFMVLSRVTLSQKAYGHTGYGGDNTNHPEAHGNFIRRPALGLKMVVNGGGQKHFFAMAQLFGKQLDY